VPCGEALRRPPLRELDHLVAQCVDVTAGVLALDLDHDLVERRLDVPGELVPLLRDDRERLEVVVQLAREIVDLCGRRPGVPRRRRS